MLFDNNIIMNDTSLSAENALRCIQGKARYIFGPDEFARLTGREPASVATKSALMRLSAAGRIRLALKRPTKWLIVPAEHAHFGAPPIGWWLHDCLHDVEPGYYLALLSAARHWGSAHYARQTTQVMVGTRRINQSVGKLRVEYTYKSDLESTPVVEVSTQVSKLRVSTREATLLDMLRHQASVGGLESIGRVAHDFRDALNATGLRAALKAMGQASVAQRLGLVLEVLGQKEMAQEVEVWLGGRKLSVIPLETGDVGFGVDSRTTHGRWSVSYHSEQIETLQELA